MNSKITIYKIRSKVTGLFSKGGSDPSFSKVGKIWKRTGDISSHFTQLTNHGIATYRAKDVEVITMEITEACISTSPGSEWLDAVEVRQQKREAESRARQAAYVRERELAELKRLQTLYPNGHK